MPAIWPVMVKGLEDACETIGEEVQPGVDEVHFAGVLEVVAVFPVVTLVVAVLLVPFVALWPTVAEEVLPVPDECGWERNVNTNAPAAPARMTKQTIASSSVCVFRPKTLPGFGFCRIKRCGAGCPVCGKGCCGKEGASHDV